MTPLVRFKTVALATTLLCAAAVAPLPAMAAYVPVEVAYTIAGSAGNWTLDFSFKNNMNMTNCPGCSPPIVQNAPSDMVLYKVGVLLSARDIVGSPAGHDPNAFTTWNNASAGGSSIIYNNIWVYNNPDSHPANYLSPQTTLSGFLVHNSEQTAPTIASWFAIGSAGPENGTAGFHSGGRYTGDGNFNYLPGPRGGATNPGFEGIAQGTLSPVPIPAAVVLFGSGLLVLVGWQWKHQRLNAAV